jgi:transcriptional regulator with XRE-family HTH domain
MHNSSDSVALSSRIAILNIYNTSAMANSGEWLRNKRLEARLTQGALAKLSGISTSYVSTLERSERHHLTDTPPQPAADVVDSIAAALNTDADEAREVFGYAPRKKVHRPPRDFSEFIEALQSLGIEQFDSFEDVHNKTPEEYEQLLVTIAAVIEASIRFPRTSKIKDIDIASSDTQTYVNNNRKVN